MQTRVLGCAVPREEPVQPEPIQNLLFIMGDDHSTLERGTLFSDKKTGGGGYSAGFLHGGYVQINGDSKTLFVIVFVVFR